MIESFIQSYGQNEIFIPVCLALALVLVIYKCLSTSFTSENAGTSQSDCEDNLPSLQSALKLVKTRRSVKPKDMSGEKLKREELELLLEAANWAPSHNGTEPWRFTVLDGSEAITDYLDKIEEYYSEHKEDIPDSEFSAFLAKMSGARSTWLQNVSQMVILGMARESMPGKRMAEWEEIAAVATSVQNMHLALTCIEGKLYLSNPLIY